MEWLLSHLDDLWLVFAQVVTLASVIVKLTPSQWDDNFVSKLLQFMSLARK